MVFPIFVVAAAAAVHASPPHARVDPELARAAGYAQAQAALSATNATPTTQPAFVAPAGRRMPSAVPSGSSGGQGPLALTCLGTGTANKLAVASGYSSGHFSGFGSSGYVSGWTSGSTTLVGTRQQGFEDQVDIRLFGGDDRIRLPRTMLPPIHGGSDGWFKLKNVVVDARSIHASAAVNFMNNPKVYIDRVTGTISISGRAGDYAAQCQAVTADAVAKF